MNKIAFLDRDGVINHDVGYIWDKKNFKWIDGAKEAIKLLKKKGYKVIVITNQSGIGKKLYTKKQVNKLHQWINKTLEVNIGKKIDAFYVCPHTDEDNCGCRKPKIGLFLSAIFDNGPIDVVDSFMIGDRDKDMQLAFAAGIKGYKFEGGNLLEFVQKNVKGVMNE